MCSLSESWVGPDQGRQGLPTGPMSKGQAPGPQSAFLLIRVAIHVDATG